MRSTRLATGGWVLRVALCLIPLALYGCAKKGTSEQPAADRVAAGGATETGGGVERAGAADPARPAPTPLTGTEWLLVDLGGAAPAGADPADSRSRPRLKLDAHSMRVTGATGLNSINGPYVSSGANGLTFGLMATTRRAGEPELMAQESAFLDALGATVTARVTGSTLRLYDDQGKELARFEPPAAAP